MNMLPSPVDPEDCVTVWLTVVKFHFHLSNAAGKMVPGRLSEASCIADAQQNVVPRGFPRRHNNTVPS